MGAVGLVLATVWFARYKEPHKDPRLTEEEKNLMREGGALVDWTVKGRQRRRKPRCAMPNVCLPTATCGPFTRAVLYYRADLLFYYWFPIYLIQGVV